MLRVAIVGRPNVGKSTLFNRLVGKRLAIVDDTPGSLGRFEFTVFDTPGLDDSTAETLEAGMQRQTEVALDQADLALFVFDARLGLTNLDRHFAEWLRRRGRPTILIANKSEGRQGDAGFYEAFELGLGEAIAVSAEHGEGLVELEDALAPYFADLPVDIEEADDGPRRIHLAIVGRPNAGKSTLVNALLGEQRVLTSEIAGTTRDAIAIDWTYEGRSFRLIDTAGLRRQSRISAPLERMATTDTLRQIRLAQIVVLMVDANAVLDKQDLTIAKLVIEEGRALVIALNKWDEAVDRGASIQRLKDRLESSLAQVKGIETVAISALKRTKLDDLMQAIIRAYDLWDTRISTAQLNRFLEGMVEGNPPPLASGRSNRLRYMTQVKARPPTFAIWCSKPDELPETYQRYLTNGLRTAFNMPGVPIRILLRKSKNPFVDGD
jgi:GTP-binding protein